MRFPKPKTPRSPEYLEFLRRQPCSICGAPPPSDPSHHGRRGVGIKASDLEAISACRRCHDMHHSRGRFPGMESMSRDEYAQRLARIAERLRARFERQQEEK